MICVGLCSSIKYAVQSIPGEKPLAKVGIRAGVAVLLQVALLFLFRPLQSAALQRIRPVRFRRIGLPGSSVRTPTHDRQRDPERPSESHSEHFGPCVRCLVPSDSSRASTSMAAVPSGADSDVLTPADPTVDLPVSACDRRIDSAVWPEGCVDACTHHSLSSHAKALVEENRALGNDRKHCLCLVVAGGGGHALSSLAATPGASSVLLEGCITYDRKSYQNYVKPSPSAQHFQYSSAQAATLASEAALRKAMQFRCNNIQQMIGCMGVACTSKLVSTPAAHATNHRSHANIVVTLADGSRLSVALDMSMATHRNTHATTDNDNDNDNDSTVPDPRTHTQQRSRLDEDMFVSCVILRTVRRALKIDKNTTSGYERTFVTESGDSIVEKWTPSYEIDEHYHNGNNNKNSSNNNNSVDGSNVNGNLTCYDVRRVAVNAATRVISKRATAVMLLPVHSKNGTVVSFEAMSDTFLPYGCIIFPGSYNPPHSGHLSLGRAAIQHSLRQQSNLPRYKKSSAIFMELSIMNADKPAIDPQEVAERIMHFLNLDGLPSQWGILLTSTPLFSEKVNALKTLIPSEEVRTTQNACPMMSFVIGTDTLVRLIDPKYYGDDRESMLQALDAMMSQGVQFIVGGRLEQRKDVAVKTKFVSGYDEVKKLPERIQKIFSIIREDEFRMDISSSEIRAGLVRPDNAT